MWGQFFYNVSYAVSSIDGILLSQNGTFLNCLGQANNKPVIMNLNKQKGQIQKFYTIDPLTPQQKTFYKTFQSLYHEERSAEDGQTYYYVSFMMAIDSARAIHFLKFSGTDLKIAWHMQKTVDNNVDDIPTMMAMDTNNLREFYLFGKMKLVSAGASVSLGLRVNKLDGKILHQVYFVDQDELGGHFHPAATN